MGEEKVRGREEEEKEGEVKRGRVRKIAFWNVAGLGNKDREFWKGLKEWDVIVMEGEE